ncbi:MAG: ORF6N domain-containing protein [Gallionella sp.]|nr:ORF6N domain-containing protein [Gallionella sp.]
MIIEIRGQVVLPDSDVANIYSVETKRINEAVKNNPDKFPVGYILELDKTEWDALKSKFSTSMQGGKVKLPSAFTEKKPVHACHYTQKPSGNQGNHLNHRNLHQDSRAIKKRQRAIVRARQNTAEGIDAA